MFWIRFDQFKYSLKIKHGVKHILTSALPVAQVNALLPTDTFITVMRGLMKNQLASVRRKAMELLNNKLQHRTQWDDQQVIKRFQLLLTC